MHKGRRVIAAAVVWVGVVACGGGEDATEDAGAGVEPADPMVAYQEMVDALDESQAPLCPPGEHRPAPAVPGDAAAPHFRYLDGRIYELGPCELPLDQRGELRVYRYADTAARDAAAASSLDRNPRPTFMWTSGEHLLVEEWLFDRAEADPAFDEVAGEVHDAMAGMPATEGVF